jgi:hypothetical protein
MPFKLFFDNGIESKYPLPDSAEDIIIAEMRKPKSKRLYKCGIEFSAVERVEHYS